MEHTGLDRGMASTSVGPALAKVLRVKPCIKTSRFCVQVAAASRKEEIKEDAENNVLHFGTLADVASMRAGSFHNIGRRRVSWTLLCVIFPAGTTAYLLLRLNMFRRTERERLANTQKVLSTERLSRGLNLLSLRSCPPIAGKRHRILPIPI